MSARRGAATAAVAGASAPAMPERVRTTRAPRNVRRPRPGMSMGSMDLPLQVSAPAPADAMAGHERARALDPSDRARVARWTARIAQPMDCHAASSAAPCGNVTPPALRLRYSAVAERPKPFRGRFLLVVPPFTGPLSRGHDDL